MCARGLHIFQGQAVERKIGVGNIRHWAKRQMLSPAALACLLPNGARVWHCPWGDMTDTICHCILAGTAELVGEQRRPLRPDFPIRRQPLFFGLNDIQTKSVLNIWYFDWNLLADPFWFQA